MRNIEKYQHYRDRSPPWVKVHMSVLQDYRFASLPDESKAHVMLMWVLQSRYGNRLPYDAKWIGQEIKATSPVNLELLRSHRFIEVFNDENDDTFASVDGSQVQTALELIAPPAAETASTVLAPLDESTENRELQLQDQKHSSSKLDKVVSAVDRYARQRGTRTKGLTELRRRQVGVVFNYWRTTHGKTARAILTPERERLIRARLDENDGDVGELFYVIDGALKDTFYVEKGYMLETILRDRGRVEKLASLIPRYVRGEPHAAVEEAMREDTT